MRRDKRHQKVKARDAARIELRRRQVEHLRLGACMTTREIAAELNRLAADAALKEGKRPPRPIVHGTVATDLKALEEQWALNHDEQATNYVKRQIKTWDRRRSLLWRRIEAAGREGDDKAVAALSKSLLDVETEQAKLLGAYRAQKLEVSGPGGKPIMAHTDDVRKILADPEATAQLLAAVQGQVQIPAKRPEA